MPEHLTPPNEPPLAHGRETVGVRPAVKGTTNRTTVELMAGLGLKYVHATNMGQRGMEGDLEKSRNQVRISIESNLIIFNASVCSLAQLLKLGYVHKSNFDEGSMDLYDKERRENSTLKGRQEQERKQKEDSTKAFDDWLSQKDMREQALKCLRAIPKPTVGEVQQKTKLSVPLSTVAASKEAGLCIQVGRAVKKVDRTLYLEWACWCDAVFLPHVSIALWDFFAPKSCDVHSTVYSQVSSALISH